MQLCEINDLDDKTLIEYVCRGRKDYFAPLMTRYERLVQISIWSFFKEAEMIKDICQEVFMRAYTALDTLRNQERFKSWLLQITFRVCVDNLRKNKITEVDLEKIESVFPASQSYEWGDSLTNYDIKAILEKLSPLDSQIIWLRYIEDLSFREVSQIVTMPETAVRQRASRTLRRLRESVS